MNKKEWTLTQIARLLDQPQHKLIYLCEKGVILPDGVDAKGRGSSRWFSAHNLFEFMVALKLGEFHIPTKLTTMFFGQFVLLTKILEKVIRC